MDGCIRIVEKIADALKHDEDPIGSDELERQLFDDPASFAKRYVKLLDASEQRFLGYYREVDPPEETADVEDLRRIWPHSPPRVKIWTRGVFARATGCRKAWLFGWNRYLRLPQLQCSEHDVEATAELLSDPALGSFTTTVWGPREGLNAKAVQTALASAISSATQDETLLIYYSGHGYSPPNGSALYLAAPDTDFDQPATAINLNLVAEAYARSCCRSLLLILDCCQSGGVSLDVSRIGKKRYRPRKGEYHDAFGYSGLRVLASSTCSQSSYEEVDSNTGLSVFTSGLLDGLQTGSADGDDNGAITDAEAFAYVRNRLASQGLLDRQSPVHHVVEGESPFLLTLNERATEPPHLYEIPPEHIEKHVAIQAMASLVRESAPVLFSVTCNQYFFREAEGALAIASGLNVSSIHTPYLRPTQKGFVCETYFPPVLVPDILAKRKRPVNGVVQCALEVRFEDILGIAGRDFTNGVRWNLYSPPDTIQEALTP